MESGVRDKYYLDYRTQTIRKNLDVHWMAPELYMEVEVDEDFHETYEYEFEDAQGRRYGFRISLLELQHSRIPFEEILKIHFERDGFVSAKNTRRIFYLNQHTFDSMLEGGND